MSPVRLLPTSVVTALCLQVISAEVIKIEHPTRGDDTRAWGPPYASYTEQSGKQGSGESAYFLAVSASLPRLVDYADITIGKPQQEVNRLIFPAQVWSRDTTQVRERLRRPCRKLSAGRAEKVWHGLRKRGEGQSRFDLCEHYWLRPDWTLQQPGWLRRDGRSVCVAE